VQVTKVYCQRDGPSGETETLIEVLQTFGDGRARERLLPLSEKMKVGEEVLETARRGVEEELIGCLAETAALLGDPPTVEVLPDVTELVEDEVSPSYPGLRCRYRLHKVKAIVRGLPDEPSFETKEYKDAAKKVLKHTLKWAWLTDAKLAEMEKAKKEKDDAEKKAKKEKGEAEKQAAGGK